MGTIAKPPPQTAVCRQYSTYFRRCAKLLSLLLLLPSRPRALVHMLEHALGRLLALLLHGLGLHALRTRCSLQR
jgi:hypothetical protein